MKSLTLQKSSDKNTGTILRSKCIPIRPNVHQDTYCRFVKGTAWLSCGTFFVSLLLFISVYNVDYLNRGITTNVRSPQNTFLCRSRHAIGNEPLHTAFMSIQQCEAVQNLKRFERVVCVDSSVHIHLRSFVWRGHECCMRASSNFIDDYRVPFTGGDKTTCIAYVDLQKYL